MTHHMLQRKCKISLSPNIKCTILGHHSIIKHSTENGANGLKSAKRRLLCQFHWYHGLNMISDLRIPEGCKKESSLSGQLFDKPAHYLLDMVIQAWIFRNMLSDHITFTNTNM